MESDRYNIPASLRLELERLQAMKPWANSRYTYSDVGNGYLFADFFKETARYVADRGCWYVYNGKVWEADRSAIAVMSLCKRLTWMLGQLVTCVGDEELRQRLTENANRWRNRRTREIALKEAAEVYPLRMDAFDADPMVLNCLNGTLELRSCLLRPHSPADLITRMANVEYREGAVSPLWEDFVLQVCESNFALHPERRKPPEPDEDADRIVEDAILNTSDKLDYLQKAMGYSLTGLTHHECMHILYGPSTRNGKSTLLETFSTLMGDYAASAMPETIASNAFLSGRGPSEDVARLAGTRFVTLAEPDKGLRISPSMIKRLTGNDTITCRFLHENSFEYRPQFKLFLNTNHLPPVGDDSVFRSGRMRVLPFERHFDNDERDPDLKRKLTDPEVLSAILNWALTGLERMDEKGLLPPDFMLNVADEYRMEGNAVGMFVADYLVPEEGARLKTVDVYRAYRIWCEENGFHYENSASFLRELSAFGKVTKGRIGSANTRIFTGYSFSSPNFGRC